MDAKKCVHKKVTLVDFDDRFTFVCHGCHQRGYGTCYHCADGCDYQLHEECLTASPVDYFSFFGDQLFILKRRLSGDETGELCDACGMGVKGLMYVCTDGGSKISLHPCCMKLPHIIETDDGDRFSLKMKLKFLPCQYCKRPTLDGKINGWAYISADQQSACHIKCMKDRLYEDWVAYVAEEIQGTHEGPWWVGPHCDDSSIPCIGSSTSTSSQPLQQCHTVCQQPEYYNVFQPSQYVVGQPQYYAPPQQNSLAVTSAATPTGRKRRIFWKFTKVAVKIFIHTATGDPISLIMAFHDLLC